MSRVEHIGDVELRGFPDRVVIYAIKGDRAVYVGSTSQQIRLRIRAHIADAKRGSELPIHQWMRNQQFKFAVQFLEESTTETRIEAEQRWISKLQTPLNVTDGGAGMSGHKFAGSEHAARIGSKLRTGASFVCETCGASFWRKRRDIIKGNTRFCSRGCYQIWQRGKSKDNSRGLMGVAGRAAALKAKEGRRNAKMA